MRSPGIAAALATALLGGLAGRASAQAALLFGYAPHAGQEAAFHEGYSEHLDWHRANRDSLIWYGWEVMTGDRLGVFIDGTFGRPFLAIDRRVDPAGDVSNFRRTAAPYADALFRRAYALREDLSTGTPLEHGQPTRLLEVVTYRVRPGAEHRFGALIGEVRTAVADRPDVPPFTWYEAVNGDRPGTFILLVHRSGFAEWDSARADLASLIDLVPDEPERVAWAAAVAEIVVEAHSELWRYLPASSLIPENEDPAGG